MQIVQSIVQNYKFIEDPAIYILSILEYRILPQQVKFFMPCEFAEPFNLGIPSMISMDSFTGQLGYII